MLKWLMQFLRKKRDFDWIFYNMYDNNSFSPFLLFFTESIFLFMFLKNLCLEMRLWSTPNPLEWVHTSLVQYNRFLFHISSIFSRPVPRNLERGHIRRVLGCGITEWSKANGAGCARGRSIRNLLKIVLKIENFESRNL